MKLQKLEKGEWQDYKKPFKLVEENKDSVVIELEELDKKANYRLVGHDKVGIRLKLKDKPKTTLDKGDSIYSNGKEYFFQEFVSLDKDKLDVICLDSYGKLELVGWKSISLYDSSMQDL